MQLMRKPLHNSKFNTNFSRTNRNESSMFRIRSPNSIGKFVPLLTKTYPSIQAARIRHSQKKKHMQNQQIKLRKEKHSHSAHQNNANLGINNPVDTRNAIVK